MQRRLRDVIIAMASFYSASSNDGIYCYYFYFLLPYHEAALLFFLFLSLYLLLTYPCCHGNEIWNKTGYNSVFTKDILKIFESNGGRGVGDGLLDEANLISPRPSFVAVATKFETKLTNTACKEISPRSLGSNE